MPSPTQSFAEIITAARRPQIVEHAVPPARHRPWLLRFLMAPFADMDYRVVWRKEKLRAEG